MTPKPMPISRWWFQGALLTYLFGFTVLGVLAWLVYAEQPPIPGRVVDERGQTLFTRDDIMGGMHVFQQRGGMEYGSVYGHGAYLGPDFTADYLHRQATLLVAAHARNGEEDAARQRTAAELHENAYDPLADVLPFGAARAEAHRLIEAHYAAQFMSASASNGLQAGWISDREQVRRLAAFFAWTAWTASTNRPGKDYSYTNNWPSEPLAGNYVTAQAVTWSAVSVIGLLGGAGLIFYFFGRYDWLGWKARRGTLRFRQVADIALTPAQRMVAWFLLFASLLFLAQTLLGGVVAHYRADPAGFYGWDLSRLLPYNVARTWHLQLAIFWVATAFLAAGIFLVPLISGREPPRQATLAGGLLAALVVVVGGSLAGEYAGVKGWLGEAWFWVGHQGWEYLDLGRLWQLLLICGLFAWFALVARGLLPALRREAHGNMPWLLLYASFALPAFYAVGLLAGRDQGFVIADFWRFWVVHLWVEDFLELLTTVMVAYLFVLLGMVRENVAIRVIYLDVILYSAGGVIGTMHHLYFSGAPAAHMALGATFSALEVLPLLLLSLEAWAFLRAGERSMAKGGHPHEWAVWFLVAVGVWNFLGAGVFGFLINLPVVSYYEIGTNLTANHAHTAMMGVYGMLGAGLLLFCLRYLTHPDHWSDRAAKISFWSLNIGLAWMSFVNLFPTGMAQLYHALSAGYAHARSPAFLAQRWVNLLEWARLPGDVLFIAGGVVPLVWLCWQAVRHPHPRRAPAGEALPTQLFTETHEEESRASS